MAKKRELESKELDLLAHPPLDMTEEQCEKLKKYWERTEAPKGLSRLTNTLLCIFLLAGAIIIVARTLYENDTTIFLNKLLVISVFAFAVCKFLSIMKSNKRFRLENEVFLSYYEVYLLKSTYSRGTVIAFVLLIVLCILYARFGFYNFVSLMACLVVLIYDSYHFQTSMEMTRRCLTALEKGVYDEDEKGVIE